MRADKAGRTGLAAGAPAGYGPADLQAAYHLPSATGGDGALVAIVDAYDNPNAEQDLAVYRQQYGLSPCTAESGCFTKVSQRGQPDDLPRADVGWAQEISLDLDMVSAACPRCRLLLVEADTDDMDDLGQAVNTAVQLGAKYVSNSYGITAEATAETDLDPYYDHPGVAITASSGDDGYGVTYPAASPLVTAVGATSLVRNESERGWDEQVWAGAGSGCSRFEPKPQFQSDSGCPTRTVADVAAVGDPETGVAMYDSFNFQGWAVFGGTSASAPLIASAYALAGEPVAQTQPNTYVYDKPDALFDVTAGNNGSCGGSYLCTGKPGFDGPTGLGTPNGVAAFHSGPHGTLAGRVTDTRGHAIAGAKVSAGGRSAVSGSDGEYELSLLAGTYDLTANAYGYTQATSKGVVVGDGARPIANFTLAKIPTATVSGTVRDGSGHGWPLYARLTIDGVPGGPVFTDPVTGHYRVDLPHGTYTMHVSTEDAGYQGKDVPLTVSGKGVTADVDVAVDAEQCPSAAGYAYRYDGVGAEFTGWTGTSPQDGWTVTDAEGHGQTWAFDDPGQRGNRTGGTGTFATLDADAYGTANGYDSALVSPVVDLGGQANPVIGFRSDFKQRGSTARAFVDLSVDGGATWTTVWHKNVVDQNGAVQVPIPQAAGKSGVQVRFHYDGYWSWWWQLDDVYIGQRSCVPTAGGVVTGVVTDANTGKPVTAATVRDGGATAVSQSTPDDPNLPDGYYRMFLPGAGRHTVTATYTNYQDRTEQPTIVSNRLQRQNFSLAAGRLSVNKTEVTVRTELGAQQSTKVNFTNRGARPVHVRLGEQDGGAQPAARSAVPVQRIKGDYRPGRRVKTVGTPANAVPAGYAGPWQPTADYPTPVSGNGVGVIGGRVYSVGGYNGVTTVRSGYRYNPITKAWTPIADMGVAREDPQVAVLAGKLYVTGGTGLGGDAVAQGEVYDPATDRWTPIADNPDPNSQAGSAVLDGKWYVVGGCSVVACDRAVLVYDPAKNTWSRVANYPTVVHFEACGGIDGVLYCAGGIAPNPGPGGERPIVAANAYDPATDTWTSIPDMPHDFWGSSYAVANGELLVSGGVIMGFSTVTNEGVAYNPATRSWHALPNAMRATYGGGSACGFYKIGGFAADNTPSAESEVLPGYDQCGVSDVPWLSADRSEFDVAPGHSVQVAITASAAGVTEFGEHKAWLLVSTDTPYVVSPVAVTMRVDRPKTWGEITGTVTGRGCTGEVAALTVASVRVDGRGASYPLGTGPDGRYSLWLDQSHNPLSVVAAKDGYRSRPVQPQVRPGRTTTQNLELTQTCG